MPFTVIFHAILVQHFNCRFGYSLMIKSNLFLWILLLTCCIVDIKCSKIISDVVLTIPLSFWFLECVIKFSLQWSIHLYNLNFLKSHLKALCNYYPKELLTINFFPIISYWMWTIWKKMWFCWIKIVLGAKLLNYQVCQGRPF